MPFYGLKHGQTKENIKGKALGKRELAYRLDWWQKYMTEKGKAAVDAATLEAPCKFQCCNLVARKEPRKDDPDASSFHLLLLIFLTNQGQITNNLRLDTHIHMQFRHVRSFNLAVRFPRAKTPQVCGAISVLSLDIPSVAG